MKIQRLLYNQYNADLLHDNVDLVVVLHTDGAIQTQTSAGKLKLHILSRLVDYAAGKTLVDELSRIGQQAIWLHGADWVSLWSKILATQQPKEIIVMDSSEPYIQRHLDSLFAHQQFADVCVTRTPNIQFLLSHEDFRAQYDKPPVMETFYRRIRKNTGILMDDNQKPIGGQRNFDKDNRKFDKEFVDVDHLIFDDVPQREEACGHYAEEITQWGHATDRHYPVSRQEALDLLEYFVEHLYERFGELEDAMYHQSDLVHHSLLSIPLNLGLLSPQEILSKLEEADAPINSKEGIIRQILWRREYMYHRFRFYADDIYEQNALNHTRDVPDWRWKPSESPADLACLNHVLDKVDRLGYSHHIERLMVIGNIALLYELDPHQVNKWFWERYVDAYERVVTPNVLGMSQFADGGRLATKPYISSANYINKMSNHCSSCRFDPKIKEGPDACPLNLLYWRFVDKHQDIIKKWRQWFLLKHLASKDMDSINRQCEDLFKDWE